MQQPPKLRINAEANNVIADYLSGCRTSDPQFAEAVHRVAALRYTTMPDVHWHVVREAVRQAADDVDLRHVACGPLESLLARDGPKWVQHIEREAGRDPKFARAVTGVPRSSAMSDQTWTRLKAVKSLVPPDQWLRTDLQDELSEALGRDDYARVEALVAAGARLTPDEANGWLHHAIAARPADVRQARLALEAGADVNHASEIAGEGNQTSYLTPLATAAAGGDLEAVRFLIEAGADVNGISYTVDDYWEEDSDDPDADEPPKQEVLTALDIAAREGHRDVYEYLWPLTPPAQRAQAEALKTW